MLDDIKGTLKSLRILPDVAKVTPDSELQTELAWVGMQSIELPILLSLEGRAFHIPAKAQAMVNLVAKQARGIHMSRLYQVLQEEAEKAPISVQWMQNIAQAFLDTQSGLSDQARLCIQFELPIQRQSLKSQNRAWRSYPVWIAVEKKGQEAAQIFMQVKVSYSSTCPASAALARQLIQENFKTKFSEQLIEAGELHQWLGSTEGIIATPHAQRSTALVNVQLRPGQEIDFFELIEMIESALKTPVQTIVKREDEQEFALRNGQNLMFCEDAARRVQAALKHSPKFEAYWGEMRHIESLHPHDAISHFASKMPLKYLPE